MKLINQSAQYLPQQAGIDGIYKQIELAGRTSYLSWDKMTDDSAKKFVDMLIKSRHFSVLEHGAVYLKIPFISDSYGKSWWRKIVDHDKLPSPFQEFNIINESSIKASKYYHNKYSKCHIESTYKRCSPITTKRTYVDENKSLSYDESDDYKYDDDGIYFEHIAYITTNFRVIIENNWLDDLKYICEPTEFHEKRLSMKVITDIGVTREFNRHRTFSIVEQSTRYCNFSKDKFGNELTFIIPNWLDIPEGSAYWHDGICFRVGASDENLMMGISVMPANFDDAEAISCYLHSLDSCNRAYMRLLKAWENKKEDKRFRTGFKNNPLTPQQARQVLPLCTKTEVVYTAFESDWREWFAQRLFGKTGEPHPQIKQLAELIKQEFEKVGVWEGIMKYPSKYET